MKLEDVKKIIDCVECIWTLHHIMNVVDELDIDGEKKLELFDSIRQRVGCIEKDMYIHNKCQSIDMGVFDE